MSENNTNPPAEESPPQFGLATLLWFVFLCAMYFSQFQCRGLLNDLLEGSLTSGATGVATIWIGWLMFAWFYRSKRFHVALIIHYLFLIGSLIVFVFVVIPVLLFGTDRHDLGDWVRVGFLVVSASGLWANFVSFPACVLAIISRAIGGTQGK